MEILTDILQPAYFLIDFIIHIDVHLNAIFNSFGPWIYVILFAIIFCETGLVVTPFLPGDSLLFAVGALAASNGSSLDVNLLFLTMTVAAILGDSVNYAIGSRVGPQIFKSETSIWLNKDHLNKAWSFYENYGGKTIILARFMPIVRTFAPFVAGIGKMNYRRFFLFNVVGALVWIASFLWAGLFFGNMPVVKENFHIVIIAIIVISFMPPLIEFVRSRRQKTARA
jgi:membrane-associated protein